MSEYVPGLLWLFVLLAGNAFFVGAEFAVISARRSQIEPRAQEGGRAAKTTLWAMEHATLMLATSQLGITVCSLLILNVSEPAIHHLLEYPLGATPMSETSISITAFVIALLLVTYLHVVFGEMVPKNLAFSVPDRAALILAPPLVMFSRIFRPVIAFLNGVANAIVKLCGVEPKDEANATFTLEEVADIVEQSQREGTLGETPEPLTRAFEFTDKTAGDIEVPLAEVVSLPTDATPADILRAVVEHGYSRYVLSDNGRPGAYVHMKDVMEITGEGFDQPVPSKRQRRLISVARDADLEDALARMRQQGVHMALSVDQDGTPRGLLFLEDALEVLVGEIHDATAS
jgi:CBS domain containing-hemolysin-like protein